MRIYAHFVIALVNHRFAQSNLSVPRFVIARICVRKFVAIYKNNKPRHTEPLGEVSIKQNRLLRSLHSLSMTAWGRFVIARFGNAESWQSILFFLDCFVRIYDSPSQLQSNKDLCKSQIYIKQSRPRFAIAIQKPPS